MPINHSWFCELAFGPDSLAGGVLDYDAHRRGIASVKQGLGSDSGIALLLGPDGAGKSTICRELADSLSAKATVVNVSGVRRNAPALLAELLAQFGYANVEQPADKLLDAVVAAARANRRAGETPIIILDDADRLYPSGLRVLDQLAALDGAMGHAVRMVLTGKKGLRRLVGSQQLAAVGRRVAVDCELEPMRADEALTYLHARLEACGVGPPEEILPENVCGRLYERSDGWPGLLNAEALAAIESAPSLPVTLADVGVAGTLVAADRQPPAPPATAAPVASDGPPDAPESEEVAREAAEDDAGKHPRLVLSRDGQPVSTHTITERKVLIGRSEFADVVVPDGFVSKLHAMLLLYSDALVLLDLNSANGLTVNSTTVSSTILRTGDVIVLGNHRMKVENAPKVSEAVAKVLQSGDTRKMKSLIDSRRRRLLKARLKVVDS